VKHLTPKPLVTSILILVILGLGFFSVLVLPIPKVQAHNPIITFEVNNACTSCGATQNEFGTIQAGNGFNPSLVAGQGVINMIYCTSATLSPVIVTSITDTLGDVWTQDNFISAASSHTNNPTTSYSSFEWYTNMVTTASSSFVITINFSPSAGTCEFILSLANYGITPITSQITGGFQSQRGSANMTSSVITSPINALTFVASWSNYTSLVGQPGNSVLGLNQYKSIQLCAVSSCLTATQYYGFYTVSLTRPLLVTFLNDPSHGYGFGYLAVIYNINTIFAPTCQDNNCPIAGGGITPGITQFTLTANETYYYVANSGIGGVTIQNLTTKIDSYNNGNPGKQFDTVDMMIYRQFSSTTGTSPPISLTNPLNIIATTSFTNVATGTFANWLHAPSTLAIVIPPNTMYAVAIESIFAGLGLYQALNAQPMYEQPVLITSTQSTWQPPSQITQQIIQTPQLFFSFYGSQGVFNIVSTSTFTSVSTCAALQTCVTTTNTIYNTNTQFSYVRPANQTNISDLQDVETYFPIWVLPLIFSPFGVQGILIGLTTGIILGAVLGIIPLWAGFILSIGLVYVLYKRG